MAKTWKTFIYRLQLKTSFHRSLYRLYVTPLGLNIPVGWRQPSYKVKRKTEYSKASFHIQFPFFLRDPVGIDFVFPSPATGRSDIQTIKTPTENEFSSKSLSFVCDPVGIQTQDLQNRNLTLYSAKLRGHKRCKGKQLICDYQIFHAIFAFV